MLMLSLVAEPLAATSPLPEMRMPKSAVFKRSKLASPDPDSISFKAGVLKGSTRMSPEPDADSADSLGSTTVTITFMRVDRLWPFFQRTTSVAPWAVDSTTVSSKGNRLSSALTWTFCVAPWRTTRFIEPFSATAWKSARLRVSVLALPLPLTDAAWAANGMTIRQATETKAGASQRAKVGWIEWFMGAPGRLRRRLKRARLCRNGRCREQAGTTRCG